MNDDSVTWPTMDRVRHATGATHEVGPGQLFFSMTDHRGLITAANSVFVELARFPREELIGSPHSIIRHPDMPAGCFKLMWDAILAGRPFCCYVNNLARDGSTYTVFATVAPAGDAFLSVRVRPLRRDLLEQAMTLYGATRPVELAARGHGVNRRGTAAIGLDKLEELLADAGYGCYDEFQWEALMAEAEARAGVPSAWANRPNTRGPLADMLTCCRTLAAELRRWSGHYAAITDMARLLSEATVHLIDAADTATRTAAALSAAEAEGSTPAAAFLISRLAQTSTIMNELVEHLLEVRSSCCDSSTWVALAELHTDALSQFVGELLDNRLADDDRDAVGQLCQALSHDFSQVRELSEQNAAYASTLVHELDRAYALITAGHQDIAGQRLGAFTSTELVGRIQAEAATVEQALKLIARLGHQATAISQPQDTRLVDAQVARLLEVMDSLA